MSTASRGGDGGWMIPSQGIPIPRVNRVVVGIAVLWIKKARKYSITHLYKAIHKT